MPIGDDPDPTWLPPPPSPTERIRAIEEFARSSVFARVVAMRARQRELARTVSDAVPTSTGSDEGAKPPPAPEPEPIHVPADAWSLARVDARLTNRLGLF
jgi:hypothetical protein